MCNYATTTRKYTPYISAFEYFQGQRRRVKLVITFLVSPPTFLSLWLRYTIESFCVRLRVWLLWEFFFSFAFTWIFIHDRRNSGHVGDTGDVGGSLRIVFPHPPLLPGWESDAFRKVLTRSQLLAAASIFKGVGELFFFFSHFSIRILLFFKK